MDIKEEIKVVQIDKEEFCIQIIDNGFTNEIFIFKDQIGFLIKKLMEINEVKITNPLPDLPLSFKCTSFPEED